MPIWTTQSFSVSNASALIGSLKGGRKSGMGDDEILTAGLECFDGLYEFLQRR